MEWENDYVYIKSLFNSCLSSHFPGIQNERGSKENSLKAYSHLGALSMHFLDSNQGNLHS